MPSPRTARFLLALLFPLLAAACRSLPTGGAWCPLESGVDASLRGLSAIDAETCWASGSGGVVLRTTDGHRWERLPVPGAEELDFRDVEAFDADTALVVSAGAPARIYRTSDGGRTWSLVYENPDERAFFDAMAFWDEERGLAFSDPVDGRLLVIATSDGGRSWHTLPREAFPPSPDGEAGFAASGTCLATSGVDTAWIGLGGTSGARVFRTTDAGESWEAVPTPMLAGRPSQGIFSLAALDPSVVVAVGGDYEEPLLMEANAMRTHDGGTTWQPVAASPPTGYRSAVTAVPGRSDLLLAVGPNGTDFSVDGGRTWSRLSDEGFHAVAAGEDGSVWAAGAGGKVGRLEWSK